jgi:hypothetical protein
MELFRKLQKSGALGFRIREKMDKDTINLLFFRDESLTSEQPDDIRKCKRLLKLDPDAREFNLCSGRQRFRSKKSQCKPDH